VSRQDRLLTEVISLMDRTMPSGEELEERREFCERMAELRARKPQSPGPFPATEDMIREDKDR